MITAEELMSMMIFKAAIREHRCAELFACLIEGGSATCDKFSGQLVLLSAEQLAEIKKDYKQALENIRAAIDEPGPTAVEVCNAVAEMMPEGPALTD